MANRIAVAALVLLASVSAAAADEVWRTAQGDVAYLSDLGDTAVLSLAVDGSETRFYFPGLAGNVTSRNDAPIRGYWIHTGPGDCNAILRGPDKMQSSDWGSAVISFVDPGFPSAWTMLMGTCFGELDEQLTGAPRVGG